MNDEDRGSRGPRRDFGPRRTGGFNRGRSHSAPREMHKAKCADCGAECEVPFKPAEDRPVYCRDCYANHRPPKRSFDRRRD